MGCNESKQAVATSNTISRRPFRKKLSINPKDLETIPENILHIVPPNPSAVQQQQQQQQVESNSPNDDHHENAVKQQQVESAYSPNDDHENAVKNASVNNDTDDLKTDEQPDDDEVQEKVGDENVVVNTAEGDDQELGKSIFTSPDHYFSSRKDEDATESVGTNDDGYFSPNHDSVKDLKEEANDDDVMKEKSLADEHETSLIEEEEKLGNANNSKKPNVVQADQVMKAVEASNEVLEVTRIEDKENPIISQDSPRDLSTQATKAS